MFNLMWLLSMTVLRGDGEILAALLGMAAPDTRLLGAIMAASRSTVRANRLAVPAETFEVFAGLGGVLKVRSIEHGYLIL